MRAASCSAIVLLPEPETPITTSAKGVSLPTKILRKRRLVDQPDRLAGAACAAGRQVLACEQARQDRALAGARDLEQHFAARGERGRGEGNAGYERLDIGARHADDPARGLLKRGISGKQRCGVAVGA